MKKKIWVLLILLILIALLIPIPRHLKDGGTVEYTAILYKVSKVHRLSEESTNGYREGITIEVLGKEVYSNLSESKNGIEKTSKSNGKDFEVLNQQGEKVHLSQFYGKPIVLTFWATWCNPCKEELPVLEEMYQEYGEKVNFLIVNATSWQEDIEEVTNFVKDTHYHFPVYLDTEGSAVEDYGIEAIPQVFFLDKQGNIHQKYIGEMDKETIEQNIQEILEKQGENK